MNKPQFSSTNSVKEIFHRLKHLTIGQKSIEFQTATWNWLLDLLSRRKMSWEMMFTTVIYEAKQLAERFDNPIDNLHILREAKFAAHLFSFLNDEDAGKVHQKIMEHATGLSGVDYSLEYFLTEVKKLTIIHDEPANEQVDSLHSMCFMLNDANDRHMQFELKPSISELEVNTAVLEYYKQKGYNEYRDFGSFFFYKSDSNKDNYDLYVTIDTYPALELNGGEICLISVGKNPYK